MSDKLNFTRIMGVVLAGSLAAGLVSSPVLAQDAGSDCVCIVDPSTVGAVTSTSGWVKLNGDVGLVDATPNAPLSLGSVLRTGSDGSAGATVGAGCNVDVAALSELSLTSLADGRMCVRLTGEAPVVPVAPVAAIGGGAIIAGGALLFGLGQDDPVSQ